MFFFHPGSCIILDNTRVLNIYLEEQSSVSIARKYDLLHREPIEDDHDYMDAPNIEHISEYKDACINYIGGYVSRALGQKLKCMTCVNALSYQNRQLHAFVALANQGGLTNASESVVAICSGVEKCFQRLKNSNGGNLPHGGGIAEAIACAVLMNLGDKTIFPELYEHQFETTFEDNHQHSLVKSVARHFKKVRLYHLGKRETERIMGQKVRRNLSKMILFKHQ